MQPEILNQLPAAAPVLHAALAQSMLPAPRMTISEWAQNFRKVSADSGSRYPGDWDNARAPHCIEVMDALSPEDPCEDVVLMWSAQTAKTETGLNFFGFIADRAPGPALVVLPSHDEAKTYVRTKLQPAIDGTPAIRHKVLEQISRSETGSTASFKRLRGGGFARITFAGSSKGLQMVSIKYVIADEIDEWPQEAGERGDPVTQIKKRTVTYERDRKRLWTSTPGLSGSSRIAVMYSESDARRRYVPCPHCGQYQVLRFDRLKWMSDSWPHRAFFECAGNGCVIEHLAKPSMMAAGVWIPTAGEDGPPEVIAPEDLENWRSRRVPSRCKGYHLWQAYSLMTTWDGIVAEWLEARDKPAGLIAFTQQVLGEPYEDRGDAPDAEKLHAARVVEFKRGRPPVGPVVFTGATDVQGNRLEWAVWGWSEGMTRWLCDWGVIEGDPSDPQTWARHDEIVMNWQVRPGGGMAVKPDAWAVDSGYQSQAVYNYVRGRPGLYAIDGRPGRMMPFVGFPRSVDITVNGKRVKKGAMIWPLGTFALKSDHYSSIRRALSGPDDNGVWRSGAMILPGDMPLAYAEQLTAEHLRQVEMRSGMVDHRWEKLSGRPNEALDIACYARAMASHLKLDQLTPEEWASLRAERCGSVDEINNDQPDLFAVNIASHVQASKPQAKQEKPKSTKTAGSDWLGERGKAWL